MYKFTLVRKLVYNKHTICTVINRYENKCYSEYSVLEMWSSAAPLILNTLYIKKHASPNKLPCWPK